MPEPNRAFSPYSLCVESREAFTAVPLERRRAIRELPPDPGAHAALLAELPAFHVLEASPPARSAEAPARAARVAAWNAERCKHPGPSADLLRRLDLDVLLLSEMDVGMARSGQRHTPRDLADRLGGWGCLFGVEFLELGLGKEHEREGHAGEENAVGYHGNALLSPHVLRRPALIRLPTDAAWFTGDRPERRVGGRVAVAATLPVAGVEVAFVSTHLESHSDPALRRAQTRALLDAVEAYAQGAPVVIGGDLNTKSAPREQISDEASKARLLREDPDRLVNPVPHEPLFALAEARGYDWRSCNRLRAPTQRTGADGTPKPPFGKLDWFLVRGLVATDPETVPALGADGAALSDHDLIAVTVRPRG